MPVTLPEANVGKYNKLYTLVTDELMHSPILSRMPFDDAISPGYGGSTLTYSYMRTSTHATSKARELNSEFVAQEAKRTQVNVNMSILGGSFNLDRIVINTSGAVKELEWQIKEKTKAVHDQFANLMINGTIGGANKFDGLKTLCVGNQLIDGTAIDVSGPMTEPLAEGLLELIDQGIAQMDGAPTMILCGRKMKTKLVAAARKTGYHTRSEDAFGKWVEEYNGCPILFAGEVIDDNGTTVNEVIPTAMQKSDIYLVRTGLDGVHGVSIAGGNMVNVYLPDMKESGAVKTGEVEFPCAVAVKSTRAAVRIKDITVEAA